MAELETGVFQRNTKKDEIELKSEKLEALWDKYNIKYIFDYFKGKNIGSTLLIELDDDNAIFYSPISENEYIYAYGTDSENVIDNIYEYMGEYDFDINSLYFAVIMRTLMDS